MAACLPASMRARPPATQEHERPRSRGQELEMRQSHAVAGGKEVSWRKQPIAAAADAMVHAE
eukprot:CAMPEP_0204596902 /NCGR_PEP_ID=MMETSP0661-20131031/53511_1 /ASSEMBLY_ACC=CAM_ASM_000606 /TAXON_ID=109239 /ORGANISM="Alexandrium margalefi, Strain AMGDE01CS-322" /LENGTH=61 /DNA_ID=CAMNT_0051607565 /DNA_START=146 /DNA_END=328 /DNA_ORIENTATION=+